MYLGGVPEQQDDDLIALASDLSIHAARVVRLIRQNSPQVAGVRALSSLDQHGPLGVTALAQVDNCSQPTMTGTVRQLIEAGWVSREPHPTDARSTLIALTPAGRAELARIRAANAALIASRVGHRSAAELRTALDVLRDVLTDPTTTDPTPEIEEIHP
jgi:DNA-binding MarR family transcriptional regulator